MSGSTPASDEKKPTASSAVVVTTAAASQIPSAFSIDGLLGLKQQEGAADKKTGDEGSRSGGYGANSKQLDTASTSSNSAHHHHPAAVAQASAATTHLVYSAAAAAASTMVPSPALHGTLWSSHPASIAAFRCKYMHVQCMHM